MPWDRTSHAVWMPSSTRKTAGEGVHVFVAPSPRRSGPSAPPEPEASDASRRSSSSRTSGWATRVVVLQLREPIKIGPPAVKLTDRRTVVVEVDRILAERDVLTRAARQRHDPPGTPPAAVGGL